MFLSDSHFKPQAGRVWEQSVGAPGCLHLILKDSQVLLHVVSADGRLPLAAGLCHPPECACAPALLGLPTTKLSSSR